MTTVPGGEASMKTTNVQPGSVGSTMSHVTYKVVRHDDGWAYTVDGVYSEAFPTHAAALAAARRVAAEQRIPGRTEAIEWEDEKGRWHSETARGTDLMTGAPGTVDARQLRELHVRVTE